MKRDLPVWVLVFLVMFGSAWAYAATLKASSTAQGPLATLDVAPLPAPVNPLHPLPSPEAPADPFAPAIGAQPAPPPPAPLPPAPLPPPPPEPSPNPPTPPTATEAPFKLTGIVLGTVRRAILEVKETAYIVKEGDTIDGWTVVRIEPRRVILRSPDGQEVILEFGT